MIRLKLWISIKIFQQNKNDEWTYIYGEINGCDEIFNKIQYEILSWHSFRVTPKNTCQNVKVFRRFFTFLISWGAFNFCVTLHVLAILNSIKFFSSIVTLTYRIPSLIVLKWGWIDIDYGFSSFFHRLDFNLHSRYVFYPIQSKLLRNTSWFYLITARLINLNSIKCYRNCDTFTKHIQPDNNFARYKRRE